MVHLLTMEKKYMAKKMHVNLLKVRHFVRSTKSQNEILERYGIVGAYEARCCKNIRGWREGDFCWF